MIEWIISSSLLILVMIALRYLLRGRIKPRFQYALWALVLVRLLLPIQFGSAPISVENAVSQAPIVQEMEFADQVTYFDYHLDGYATGYYTYTPVEAGKPQPENQNEPVPELFTHAEADRLTHLRSVKEIVFTVWVGGMILMGVAFLVSNLVFAGRLRKSRKLLEKGKLPIYVSGATETPCLFGLFRSAVYLTTSVAEEEHHKEYAITHEMTHYRQGDALWSILRSLCLVLHWYNPLVWWAVVLSREDGEIACDEATIAILGENQRAEYGRVLINLTILKTSDLLRTATTMTGSAKGLKERIKMIAKKPKMTVYTLIAVILVAAVAVGCTFTGSNKEKDPTDPTEITEPSDPTKPTEPAKVDYLKSIVGTSLTEEELAYFTELFGHKDTVEKEEDINWYNILLTCGWDYGEERKGFTVPENVNMDTLFNNGFREISYTSSWTAEELVFIRGFYPEYPQNCGDIYRLPVERMNKVLQDYLGITLEKSNKVALDMMEYFADTNCYFGAPAGAVGEQDVKMIDGKKAANGTVYLVCTTDHTRILDEMLLLALVPAPEGSARPYLVQMCTEVKK